MTTVTISVTLCLHSLDDLTKFSSLLECHLSIYNSTYPKFSLQFFSKPANSTMICHLINYTTIHTVFIDPSLFYHPLSNLSPSPIFFLFQLVNLSHQFTPISALLPSSFLIWIVLVAIQHLKSSNWSTSSTLLSEKFFLSWTLNHYLASCFQDFNRYPLPLW